MKKLLVIPCWTLILLAVPFFLIAECFVWASSWFYDESP